MKSKRKQIRVYITEKSNKKCGGCNWGTETYYGIGKTKADAKKKVLADDSKEFKKEYGLGLCADCLVNFLINNRVEIFYKI